jgi:hypothetical protein
MGKVSGRSRGVLKMFRRISTVVCLFLTLPGAVYGAAAPRQLFGRSIVVSWSESQSRRISGDSQFSHAQVRRDDSVYISSAGRAFNRGSSREPGTSTASTELAPDSAKNTRGSFQSVHFEGRTLFVDTELASGARRVIIDFDDAFQTCNARIVYGKEGGGAKPVVTNSARHPGLQYEHQSVEIQNLSCVIKDGNVFGGQQD